jgi:hypothetical protein
LLNGNNPEDNGRVVEVDAWMDQPKSLSPSAAIGNLRNPLLCGRETSNFQPGF